MIIYNITLKVEHHIAEKWLQWLKKEHIPEIMHTNCFTDIKLVRLLEVDDSEGPTYAVQFFSTSKSDYNRYVKLHADSFNKKSFDRWGEQFFAFRSVMEVVQ